MIDVRRDGVLGVWAMAALVIHGGARGNDPRS
jgi:hypothetical protein